MDLRRCLQDLILVLEKDAFPQVAQVHHEDHLVDLSLFRRFILKGFDGGHLGIETDVRVLHYILYL